MKVAANMPTVLQLVDLEKISCVASRILWRTLAYMATLLMNVQQIPQQLF